VISNIVKATFLLAILVLTSCYERIEGCLDPLATNFAIVADDPCDECCVYPAFKLQVSHFIGEDSFTKDSVMINDFGQNVQVRNAVLFVSDFVLHTDDDLTLEVNEMSNYASLDGEESELKEDHIVLEESTRFSTIGSVTDPAIIDSISAYAGINHSLISIESESELFSYDTLYSGDKYYDLVLYVRTGAILDQDISVRIKTKSAFSEIGNAIPSVNKIERTELGLKLQIDYKKLIQVIELESDVEEMIINEFELPKEVFKFTE